MRKKILVADDSLTIQKVVELMFSDSDYSLTCVSNGRQALEKVRDDPPNLIHADVEMPEKNGYEVCEEIKKNPATARIPVLLLAGTFEPFDRERAERLGCDAIVSKPFDSHQLFRKVESILAGKSDDGRTTSPEAEAPRGTAAGAFSATPFLASVPPDPFGVGFAEEDFTGSIRNLRGMGRDEPLENLYGPEDVESALEAFREVEPTARAADKRAAAQPQEAASMWITDRHVRIPRARNTDAERRGRECRARCGIDAAALSSGRAGNAARALRRGDRKDRREGREKAGREILRPRRA